MDTLAWVYDRGKTPIERSVLLTLVKSDPFGRNPLTDDIGQGIPISYIRLAHHAGISRMSTIRAIRALEQRGVITVNRGPNPSIANCYRLNAGGS